MTDEELLAEVAKVEEERCKLWQEVFRRGLAFQAIGIDPGKRDSAWRNPVITEKPRVVIKRKKEYDLTGLDDLDL